MIDRQGGEEGAPLELAARREAPALADAPRDPRRRPAQIAERLGGGARLEVGGQLALQEAAEAVGAREGAARGAERQEPASVHGLEADREPLARNAHHAR
ncbi:MAG: hypothetical protein M5U28_39600 [Sandaracinaceae bacterium]|nr:hypothetical protein [Sandaracinaceae bacterium]